jgi:hypothetical protein
MNTVVILALILPVVLIAVGGWAMFCGHRHDRDNRKEKP